jgi:serine/threonine protein kinase, bacterial
VTLTRIGTIAIPPGAKRGFDHADVHAAARRMYVAHTGADRVEVLDCDRQRFLRSIPDLPGVAGVLVDEDHDLLFTSDRAAARVSIFRCSDEQLLGRVTVGAHPNGLAYDRRRRRLHVFNLGEPLGSDCTASVVDLASLTVVAELPLPGRPRWAVYDAARDLVYANISDPPQVLLIDAQAIAVADAFEVPCPGPHGLALDSDQLFCAADGRALVVFDRITGEVVAQLRLPGAPDVLMYDRDLERLYVAVAEPGSISSFDTGRLRHVETVTTERGAKTTGWDPRARRLFVFCPGSCSAAVYEERF